jgi:hypothetical protein
MSPTAQRWVGVFGVVSMAAGTVPFFFVPSAPGSGASTADIVSFYSGHAGVVLATCVSAIAVIASIVFLAGLVALMRRIEGQGAWLWLALLVSAVGIVTAAMAQAVLGAALAFSAAATDTSIAPVMLRLLTLSYAAQFAAVVPFLGLIGWITATKRGLPAWLGYVADVAAVVCAIATLGIFDPSSLFAAGEALSYLAFIVAGVWWVLASIVLIVRPIAIAAAH